MEIWCLNMRGEQEAVYDVCHPPSVTASVQ